jgi:hypothetical protein
LDILEVRRRDPEQAAQWRSAVRNAITSAFADACTATSMTRDGWYLLSSEEDSR